MKGSTCVLGWAFNMHAYMYSMNGLDSLHVYHDDDDDLDTLLLLSSFTQI